ncbi:NAD(P)H-binding protein [Rhodococcus zopfii]|uniref:NAD(P)H-binding protein n=1 Tax=Rhodococcus zopfii TaxID=43772 RepID=A0ABU3WVE5_9NOCA|nr:NAD(P)H-binding protein [Rhodococcus zopfii]
MKIIVIGGSGRVGKRVVDELTTHSTHAVTVADRVPPRVPVSNFVPLDLSDSAALAEVIAAHDVVVNTAGPFDLWGTTVLDAAIDGRVDYVDVCDDPEATLALLARDEAARRAGIRAVIGLGVSPGLTNYLGVMAAQHLSEVDTVATFWGDSREGMDVATATTYGTELAAAFAGGRAAYTHLILQAAAEVPIWRDGASTYERAWRRGFRIRTSTGQTGVYRMIGHPEPVTLPRTVPMSQCINIGTVNVVTDRMMLPVLERVHAGDLSPDEAIAQLAQQIAANPSALSTIPQGAPLPRMIGAVATGRADRARREVIAFPGGPVDGSMSLETARPAVVGVLDIADAPIGVHAPESAFDAERFLTRYAEIYWDGAPPYLLDSAASGLLTELDEAHRS